MATTAAIISIGNELLRGDTLDTNSHFLSQQLFQLGIHVKQRITVEDNRSNITSILKTLNKIHLIITIGGLGPTVDDLTRESISTHLQVPLKHSLKIWNNIQSKLSSSSSILSNKKQAQIFEKAKVFENRVGIAPAQALTLNNQTFLLLPGPPQELKPMFLEKITPFLKEHFKLSPHLFEKLYIFGFKESEVNDLIDKTISSFKEDLIFGIYSHHGEVQLFLSLPKQANSNNQKKIEEVISKVIQDLKGAYISRGQDIIHSLKDLLITKNITLSLAESLTGGLVSSLLTKLPGSSSFFKGSIVAYQEKIKKNILKVSSHTLKKESVISKKCAIEMAIGAQNLFQSNTSISLTGLAGPTAGDSILPLGTVHVAFTFGEICEHKPYHFKGSREKIQHLAAYHALMDFYRFLQKHL